MKWSCFMGLIVLVGCAPVSTLAPKSLPAERTASLTAAFQDTFKSIGFQETSKQGYVYEGEDETAFKKILAGFYDAHPNHCPLESGFFAASSMKSVFMTVTG